MSYLLSGSCSGSSSDNHVFFFSSFPLYKSVLPSNEIFRCAVSWPTVASSDVYLPLLCHCVVEAFEEMGPQLLWSIFAASNRNGLICFCMIFYYGRWGNRIYILTLSLATFKLMQFFSKRSSYNILEMIWYVFAVYSHWCMCIAWGFIIKDIMPPPVLVFLFDTRLLWDCRKLWLNWPITTDIHVVWNRVNFDFVDNIYIYKVRVYGKQTSDPVSNLVYINLAKFPLITI